MAHPSRQAALFERYREDLAELLPASGEAAAVEISDGGS
jgi:hypothetical protein